MDISQLLVAVGSVLGTLLIGVMAVVPTAMDTDAGRPDRLPVERAPTRRWSSTRPRPPYASTPASPHLR